MKTNESVAFYGIHALSGAVLFQQRSGGSESNKLVCQPTVNGKVEDGEKLLEALAREAEEELGMEFAHKYNWKNLIPVGSTKYFYGGEEIASHNFVGLIEGELLERVIMHKDAEPEFIFINSDDLPYIKTADDKVADPDQEIVLFKDQYNVLVALFDLKKILSHLT